MVKKRKIGLFDQDWSDYSPDPKPVPEDLKKSDHRVNLAASNRRRAKDPKIRKAISLGQNKFYKNNPKAKKEKGKHLQKAWMSKSMAERSAIAKKSAVGRDYSKIIETNKSTERRKKVSMGLRKAIGRAIATPFGEFACMADFGEDKKVRKVLKKDLVFFDKMRLLPHLYYYKDKGPGKVLTQKVYYSPYGVWYRSSPMWAKAKSKGCKIAKGNIDPKNTYIWFNKMMKIDPKKFYIKVEPKREWAFCKKP
jgi:hypothetical protein